MLKSSGKRGNRRRPALQLLREIAVYAGVICLLLSAGTPLALAQVSTADIVGTATDQSKGVVPGVKITATNIERGLPYTTTSNERGEFIIPLLPGGRYRIQAEMTGFKMWNLAEVTLSVGDRFRADVQLEVGTTEQSVQVTAEAATLQTDTATVSSMMTTRQVENLPTAGRNFIELAQLVAGANNFSGGSFTTGGLDDSRRSTTVSANGRTGAENNFMIDGMDNNQKFIGSILVKPSQDAVAEMRVYTNSFSAEFARTSGAAISVITRGGTNEIHGSAFEYYRNQSLDARPPTLALTSQKPPYKQHNLGGGMGGPIIKDRTFFYGNYEVYKASLGSVRLATVPTVAMKTGDFTGQNKIYDIGTTRKDPNDPTGARYIRDLFASNMIPQDRINPISKKILAFYPDAMNTAATNNYQRNSARDQTDHTVDTRIDHRFSDKNNAFLRYSYDHAYTARPFTFPVTKEGYYVSGGGKGPQSIQAVALNNTHTLSPSMVLVLRGGFSRYSAIAFQQGVGQTPATDLGMPNINIDADSMGMPDFSMTNFTGFGDGTYWPSFNYENIFTGSGSLTYLRGAHSMKFGGDITRRRVNETQSVQPRVAFAFTNAFTADPNATGSTGNAMASFLMGYPATTGRNKYLIHPGYRMLETGWFFQDDWRVNNWLTLNPGVRYDYYSPISERDGLAPNFDFVAQKAVFPGKDGVDQNGNVQRDWNNFSPRMGFAAQVDQKMVVRGGFGINYTPLLLGTNNAYRNPPYTSTMSIETGNIAPVNKLGDPIALPVANDAVNLSGPYYAVAFDYKQPYVLQYNVTVQRQLPKGLIWSTGYAASLGRVQSGSNTTVDGNGAPPGSAAVATRRVYYGKFPGLTSMATVKNYFTSSYHSLQTTLGVRDFHGMTFSFNHTWAHAIDGWAWRYVRYAEYEVLKGHSGSDLRHRVAATWNWDLPFGRGSKSVLSMLVKNWRVNGVGTWQTSLPLSIGQTGSQTNNASSGNYGNYPNVIGDWKVADPKQSQWFNAAAFQAQPNYQWGSAPRNFLRGPKRWNIDGGLARDFPIKERYTAQVRLESFNVTNSALLSNPVTSLGSPGFGTVLTNTGYRQSQVAFKFLF